MAAAAASRVSCKYHTRDRNSSMKDLSSAEQIQLQYEETIFLASKELYPGKFIGMVEYSERVCDALCGDMLHSVSRR
ncbi:hypothetical protein Tco_1122249 [Tanacetum coccineum]|uniref:Uncharacterized protein n=1 Tax=Tanacetum coccineum TaxID=301880 RepID=A0ABQ5J3S4_9ASTR